MSRNVRTDSDYQIDAFAKGLKVFDALAGTDFEPVSVSRIQQRTGFTYDFCMRSLKTLKVCGWARQTPLGWAVGGKLLRVSAAFNDAPAGAQKIPS